MRNDTFERVIKFLLGASWGFILFGAFFVFNLAFVFGLSIAIFSTVMYVVFMLIVILLLDALHVNKQRLHEAKKHTQLLEQILESKDK